MDAMDLINCTNGKSAPIQVFHPTWDDFKDFKKFIQYMEEQGAHKAGIAKVVPPKEFVASKKNITVLKKQIKGNPIRQRSVPSQPGFLQFARKINRMSVQNFENKYCAVNSDEKADLDPEKCFWQAVEAGEERFYMSDLETSLMDSEVWNLNSLGTILDELNISAPGIRSPYVYLGGKNSSFPWHTEDADMYSINFLHYGSPKFWYSIPTQHAKLFEYFIKKNWAEKFLACPAWIRHKLLLIPPTTLVQNQIPVNKCIQNPGEFMVTFPYGYHSGFNTGANCAEAANFAMPRWIRYAMLCTQCYCKEQYPVHINISKLVEKYEINYLRVFEMGLPFSHPEKFFISSSVNNSTTADELFDDHDFLNMDPPLQENGDTEDEEENVPSFSANYNLELVQNDAKAIVRKNKQYKTKVPLLSQCEVVALLNVLLENLKRSNISEFFDSLFDSDRHVSMSTNECNNLGWGAAVVFAQKENPRLFIGLPNYRITPRGSFNFATKLKNMVQVKERKIFIAFLAHCAALSFNKETQLSDAVINQSLKFSRLPTPFQLPHV